MNLNELLGDAYKENMTIDEINAALAGMDFVSRAEVEKNTVSKKLFDKTASQLAEEKRKNSSQKAAADDATAQLMERIAVLENENKEAKRNESIASTKASLIAQGYDDALAAETATAVADGDFAKVIENQGKFLANKTKELEDKALNGTKAPAGGSATGTAMTKEKLRAMSAQERYEFSVKNPEEYKTIYGGN